jgi:hypothetical protein
MAQGGSVGMRLVGLREASFVLNEFPKRMRRKYMRVAMNAGGGVLKKAAVANVPSGANRLLKQSIAVKVKGTRKEEWYAAVGPKRGMKLARKHWSQGGASRVLNRKATDMLASIPGQKEQYINPARYAHLVERGTRQHVVSARGRTLAGFVKGKRKQQIFGRRVQVKAKAQPFLATASVTAGPAALKAASEKLRWGVAKIREELAAAALRANANTAGASQ